MLSLLVLIPWIGFSVLLFFLASLFRYQDVQAIPRLFHRGVCRISGLQVEQEGHCTEHSPCLFVGNHISYLDIFVLGGVTPGFFIAKSEVAGWPLLGQLARLQNTLFFERRGKMAGKQIAIMEEHLETGGNLILFPEGTSTYGTSVVPFKSSLFKAAETAHADVLVQPVTVSYTHCGGKPMTAQYRDYFAWYDTMPFAGHFVRALGAPNCRVKVIYSDPVRVQDFSSRKEAAQHCWQAVSDALENSLQEGSEWQVQPARLS